MALAFLKIAAAIGGGVKKFIQNRKAKKEQKIQKRITSALESKEKLNAITSGFGDGDGNLSSLKSMAANLIGSKSLSDEDGGESKSDGMIKGGGSNALPSWLLPVAGIGAALLLLPKLFKGGRR